MRALSSAHFGAGFDPAIAAQLQLDFWHPTAPYHELIPNGTYMPTYGNIPVIWQASNVFGLYTPEQIRNVLKQPNLRRWIVVGNEQDLGHGDVPAQTPYEYVSAIVKNMLVMIPLIPAPRRFILSLGSKMGVDRGWARDVIQVFQDFAPGMLAMFDAFAVNYYAMPLTSVECMRWLREQVYDMLLDEGVENPRVWLKEVGCGRPPQKESDAIVFLNRFLETVAKRQARGGMQWLEVISWYSGNELPPEYQMPYVPLINAKGLTPVGESFVNGFEPRSNPVVDPGRIIRLL